MAFELSLYGIAELLLGYDETQAWPGRELTAA